MFDIIQSDIFKAWLRKLRDSTAQDRILVRMRRMSKGNLGDVKAVGEGVSEARIDYGPGYRIYFITHGKTVIVLLCGGDKRSQSRDIQQAKTLAKEWRAT